MAIVAFVYEVFGYMKVTWPGVTATYHCNHYATIPHKYSSVMYKEADIYPVSQKKIGHPTLIHNFDKC